jgi:hypothetical protein
VLTHAVAEKHGVATPPIFLVVENHGQIAGIEEALGSRREFVLKPARGSGGSGIILVVDRGKEGFVSQSGEIYSREEFAYQISDILSGIHSLGQEDRAILGLSHPDPVFAAVTCQGVPDIGSSATGSSIMVRLPTRASDGKAVHLRPSWVSLKRKR